MDEIFEQFYEKYHQDLFQFVAYMVKDRQVAEDLVQEVYVKLIRSFHTYDGRSSEKTWLFSIARHVTVDYFRKQSRKRKRIFDYFDWGAKGERLVDHKPLPEEIAVENEEMKQVYQAMEKCGVDQKTVIILRYIQQLSIKETAEILGWSESKVKTTQHRAMKKLREMLAHMGEGGIEHEA
ncbi:RNA polymerase sigma factor SigX [Halobacillus salinarum]|uniref:RNA polymerase sigma factor SigX n=1 Tax=Halobacillus salinarum TaxID=2932257 RepID=A0ABY4EDY1_9BACI|nr:RNA polymerase sigma factor SigX [Halobacillus salinarum]UOQ42670.1 RNA polymerase sigma factor SigX [Halobacillus salinarum]